MATHYEKLITELKQRKKQTLALGPGIVTKDEIDEPQNLSINVEQNGKPAMTAHNTLRPGDLITTGTPAVVKTLSDGDYLKGSIEKIGAMELNVRAEG